MHLTLFASEMFTRGGVQSYMWHLLEALVSPPTTANSQARIQTLISYADTDTLLHDPRLQPYTAAGLRTFVSGHRIPAFALNALRHTPAGSFVIVGHPAQAPVAHKLKQLKRISGYTVCLHGIEAWQAMKPAVQKALRAADKVVVTTPYTAAECSAFNHIRLTHFHTIALSAGQHTHAADPAFKLPGSFNVLFVARQDQADLYKQFLLAFDATATLRKMGIPVTLNMVGTGDYHSELKQHAAKSLTTANADSNAIVFHGRLNDAQLAAAYAQCDVFLMPSLKEGFGIVFLEAMRHAKPCIGGWQGGTPYVINDGHSGYLIPAGDTHKLVHCLARLHNDAALRAQMGQAALQRFEQEFTFEQFRHNWQTFLSTFA